MTDKGIIIKNQGMNNGADRVPVILKFVSIMQRYSGDKREVEMELPTDPVEALQFTIDRFQIPWKGNLEKSTRIFINQTLYDPFLESGKRLKAGDNIAFIPISGGG